MKGKIDWYKVLNIKRKNSILNDENINNTNDKKSYKKSKKSLNKEFIHSFNSLKEKLKNLNNVAYSIIKDNTFSFKNILSEKLNIQSIIKLNEKENNTKTTNEETIKIEKAQNSFKNKTKIKNNENLYYQTESPTEEMNLPEELSFNKQFK